MKHSEDQERKKFENEIKKAKLIAEKGALFGEFAQLPPEIESQWLDQIVAFEDAFEKGKRIKIRELLGNPALTPPIEIKENTLSSELEKIMDLLGKNNISLDAICEVTEKEMYRFIVEELLEEEIDDVRAGGWMSCFTYEEFHPNHDYDIKRCIEDFLDGLFRREKEYCDMALSKELVSYDGSKIKGEVAKKLLINFIDAVDSVALKQLEFGENYINEEMAFQKVFIDYELTINGTGKTLIHRGEGIFNFVKMYDYFYINGIEIPGLRL